MSSNETPMTFNHHRAAKLYENVWSRGLYESFSRGTSGETSTPLLELFIAEVKKLGLTKPRIAELGAGSGDHSKRLSQEGFEVTAVESSEAAVRLLKVQIARLSLAFQAQHIDMMEYARTVAAGSLHGIYANAVLHFLTADERIELYHKLWVAAGVGGLIGVSFKAQGDSLQRQGHVIAETTAGTIVEDFDDHIRRLFVTDATPLVDELRATGFQEIEILNWTVPDYNIKGRDGKFVGILARVG